MILRIQKLDPRAALPRRAYPGDAGWDIRALEGCLLQPGERRLIPTGLAVALPEGTVVQMCPRSGLALHHGVTVLNAPGIVDSGYRGELGVVLINLGQAPFEVVPGMRIAQMLVLEIPRAALEEVDALDDTQRGQGGYGSSGE